MVYECVGGTVARAFMVYECVGDTVAKAFRVYECVGDTVARAFRKQNASATLSPNTCRSKDVQGCMRYALTRAPIFAAINSH